MRPDLSPLASSPHQSKEGPPPGSLYEDGRREVGEKRETARGCLMGFLLRSLVYVARRGLIPA